MKNIFSYDCRDAVRSVVKKTLKDDFGIKVPKEKTAKVRSDTTVEKDKTFGVALDQLPSVNVGDDCYCPVPRFLVDAVDYLEPHLKTEGLFRKSGSLARQKTIRQQIENGGSCQSEITQPHDVASILKQFLRELPDSILTTLLHGTFLKCLQLNTPNEQVTSILLVCLLLPDTNLRILQYICQFVSKVAAHSEHSKMTLDNLAIILSPNLMFTSKEKDTDKHHKDQTEIVDLLFKNANSIGLVNDEISDKLNALEGEVTSVSTSSADELDWCAQNTQRRLRRRRSRSISGFVNGISRKIKGSNNGPGCTSGVEDETVVTRRSRHRRTKSDKAIEVDQLLEKRASSVHDIRPGIPGSTDCNINSPYPKPGMRALKRRAGVQRTYGQTPGRNKSPKLSRRAESCQSISNPTLISMPNQFLFANKGSLIPIMRSQEDVSSSDNIETCCTEVIDKEMSPTVLPSRFSLNLENLVGGQYDKENAKPSRKYSVMRERHLQKFIRQSSMKGNYSSADRRSLLEDFSQTQVDTTPNDTGFSNMDDSMSSTCQTPILDKRRMNTSQHPDA